MKICCQAEMDSGSGLPMIPPALAGPWMPALLKRNPILASPANSATAAAAATQSSGTATLQGCGRRLSPASSCLVAEASSSAETSRMATFMPAARQRVAVSSPKPLPAAHAEPSEPN